MSEHWPDEPKPIVIDFNPMVDDMIKEEKEKRRSEFKSNSLPVLDVLKGPDADLLNKIDSIIKRWRK